MVESRSSPETSQQKTFIAAALRLSRRIKTLEEENWKLKAYLDHMQRCSPASSRTKNYAELSKKRLVQWISKLEKKLDQLQNDRLQLSETSASPSLKPSASAQRDQSVATEPEHLCGVVKTLQREKAALQGRLSVKENFAFPSGCSSLPKRQRYSISHPNFVSRGDNWKRTEKVVKLEQNQDVDCRYTGSHAIEPPDQNPDLSCGPSFTKAAVEGAVKLIQSGFRAQTARTRTEEGSLISRPGNEKTSSAMFKGEEKPVWFPFRCSPLVFTAISTVSSQAELPPSPLLSAEEVHSDDSDEIITVSPSPVKEAFPLDFSNMPLQSLVYF